MCPKGHICCPASLSLVEGIELTIPQVSEQFQIWQSPKKYPGQQLGNDEGAPTWKVCFQGTQSMEGKQQ